MEQRDQQLLSNITFLQPTSFTAANDNTQQKTMEEIHLKVTVVKKFVIHTVSSTEIQPANAPFYMEESSPVLMKLGEREVHHRPATRAEETAAFLKSELKVNSQLCEIIPLTESIGLRFHSTSSHSSLDQLELDSTTVVSELVSLVQNDHSHASQIDGKPESKMETNPVLVTTSTQTVDEDVFDNHTVLLMPNNHNITSLTPQNSITSLVSNNCTTSLASNNNIITSLAPNNNITQLAPNNITSLAPNINSVAPNNHCITSLPPNNNCITSQESNNCITSLTPNINSVATKNHSITSLFPNSNIITPPENSNMLVISPGLESENGKQNNDAEKHFTPKHLPLETDVPIDKALTSSGSLYNTDNCSPGSSDHKNQANRGDNMNTLEGKDEVREMGMDKKNPNDCEDCDKTINPVEDTCSDCECDESKLQVGKSISRRCSFKQKDEASGLVSRQRRSAKSKHDDKCKTCRQSVSSTYGQLISNKHQCTACDKVFTSKSRLHRISEHEASSNHADGCNCICGQFFNHYHAFLDHSKMCEVFIKHNINNGKEETVKLLCNRCKTEFKSDTHLENHVCINHSGSGKYECRLCSSMFKTRNGLVRHRHKKCDVKCKNEETCKKHLMPHTEELAKGQKNEIDKCSPCVISSVGFKQHQNENTISSIGFKKCLDENTISSISFKKLQSENYSGRSYRVIEPWSCSKCKNSYTSQSTIYRHKVKGCLGEKLYKCDTCNKGFYTLEAVQEHITIHMNIDEQGRYYCSVCNKSYSQRSGYLKHKRKGLCETSSIFHCLYCPKVFVKESRRNWHQRMHLASENQQTHVCPRCSKEYFSAKSLQKHVQRNTCKNSSFSEKNKERVFICEECGKVYGSTSALFKHKQNHKGYRPYVCKFCDKSFCRSFILAQHVKIHTGDRQWLCARCGKSFYTKSHLKRHQISHDKTQDNVCDVCNKRYAYKHDLNKHKKTTHANSVKDGTDLFPHIDVDDEVVASTLSIQNELITLNNY